MENQALVLALLPTKLSVESGNLTSSSLGFLCPNAKTVLETEDLHSPFPKENNNNFFIGKTRILQTVSVSVVTASDLRTWHDGLL